MNNFKEIMFYFLKDLRVAALISSVIVPFPFLGVLKAPIWLWLIYLAWVGLFIYANLKRPEKNKTERNLYIYDLKNQEEETE